MSPHYDLLIRNALLIDGARRPRFCGDIGVRGGRGRVAGAGHLSRRHRATASGATVHNALVQMDDSQSSLKCYILLLAHWESAAVCYTLLQKSALTR